MTIKVGDKVRYTGPSQWDLTNGKVYEVDCILGRAFAVLDDVGHHNGLAIHHYEPVIDTQPAPTLWRDMTDAEKGAMLLAEHEGKVIEWTYEGWFEWDNALLVENALWIDDCAYRIKPKRETMTAKLCITPSGKSLHMEAHYRRGHYPDNYFYFTITFDLIDGKPDPASIKMEEL